MVDSPTVPQAAHVTGPGDLAPLLAANRQQTPDVGFRQGTVLTWDGAAGTNSVEIGGTTVRDLPVLNLGDFTILQPGDVVGLLRFGVTYFILGRVIPPASPDVNRATLSFATSSGFEASYAMATTRVARAYTSLPVPDWAGEAMVMVGANFGGINSRTVADYLGARIQVNGGNVGSFDQFFTADPNGGFASGTRYASLLIPDPGSIISAQTVTWVNGGTWDATGNNYAETYLQAIFRRVS